VLLSSHVLAEVEDVCDTVILMREGRVLRSAGVEELRRQASREVTLTYATTPARAPLALTAPVIDGVTITGRVPARRPELLRELLDEPGLIDLTVAPASLENVFLDMYTGGTA
jgi:ABC-2 type transport system ATP-binding protein